MPFALTPATGQPIRPPEPVDVAAIDFIVDPAIWSVTRGVGENSHIVSLRIISVPEAGPPSIGWMTSIHDSGSEALHENTGSEVWS